MQPVAKVRLRGQKLFGPVNTSDKFNYSQNREVSDAMEKLRKSIRFMSNL